MDLSLILVTIFIVFMAGYLFVKKKLQYWEKRGVPYMKPKFPFGIVTVMELTKHRSQIFSDIYKEFKLKYIFGGIFIFLKPVFIPTDLELLKCILTKDFQYFTDRGYYYNEKDDPLSDNLVLVSGHRWRNLRNKISPAFTSIKMRMMHKKIVNVAKEFQNYLEPFAKKKETIEFRDIFLLFTTDVIGKCAFGIDCNSFKEPNTEFRRMGKRIFEFTFFEFIRVVFSSMFQDFCRMLKIKFVKPDVAEYFMRFFKELIEYREKNDIKIDNILSLLMQFKNTGKLDGDETDSGKITFEELIAQMYAIFNGSYETSSSAMTLSLYELAQHQVIQEKAREEVNHILKKYNGEFTYEACMEMKYIDQIIKETLRKYPVIDVLLRRCVQDCPIPDTNHVINKGIYIIIPVYAIHHDPEIYPDPEIFDPERFTEENINNRHPYAWLPFGEGPRNCIAKRFGMMQVRIGLASLLSKYRVHVSPKTIIPPVFGQGSFTLSPKGGVWLSLEKAF